MIPLNRFAIVAHIFTFSIFLQGSALSRAQTAPPSTGLQLWVRADAGVTTNAAGFVEKWADQSGKANDALQSDDGLKPTLVANAVNGKPVIRFDGTGDYLDVASSESLAITGDLASFAVIKVNDYSTFNAIWGKSAVNIPAPNDFYLSQGTGVPQFVRGDGAAFAFAGGQRPVKDNTYVVIGIRQAGTTFTHYLNGTPNGTSEITLTPGDLGTNLKIGTRDDLFTKMNGDIAELLIYDQALTDTEVTTAINYLRTKYGIVNTPPTVSISAPANNASLPAPASVTVTVAASDPDGVVARVDVLANGVPIGSASVAPYRFPLIVETAGAVTITAIVTDDKDTTATTNITVNVTASGTAPTLTPNSHLKLWLRGEQGVTTGAAGGVTAWADQSGNNNNAAQIDESMAPTVGTLDGKPALHFDGTDDFLDVADSDSLSITGDIASFFVVKFDDFAGFRAVWAKTAGNLARPTDYYLSQNGAVPNLFRGDDTRSQGVAGARAVATNTPVVLGFQQAGSAVSHYLNGGAFGNGTITLTAQDLDTPLKVGSRDDLGTKMKGEIAELLIYDAALSSNELANVRQYLAVKYNIPAIQANNVGPTVQLTGPAGGTSVTAPGTVTLTATAADADGGVARVDFFANGSPVGSDTTSPYSMSLKLNVAGQVTLTAVAVDNLGRSTTSAAVTVTATGGETAQIPVNGLVLWLRPDRGVTAANGAVTLWEDWSGNFNNASQAAPAKAPALVQNAINGLPALHFDGTDDYLQVGNSPTVAITGDMNTFFVVNVEDYATFRAIWGKTGGNGKNEPAANDYYLLPNSGIPRFYHGTGGSTIASFDGTEPVPSGSFVTAGYGIAGTVATHYLNGLENGVGEITAPGGDAGAPLYVGTRGDLFTKLKGSLAELVIYNRALTEQERTQLETYFQNKYFAPTTTGPSISVARSGNNALVFSWPATAEGYILEATGALGAGATWTNVTEPVVPVNGQNTVTVSTSGTARFFRLKK